MQIHNHDTQPTPDLRTYAGILWRRRWWIVVTTVVVGLAAVLNAVRHDERYEASAAFLLASPPEVGVQLGDAPLSDDAERQVGNEIERLNSNDLRGEIAEVLGRPTHVEARRSGVNDVIRLVTTGGDPEQVAADVNEFLDAYTVIRHREVTAEIVAARQEVARQREERRSQLQELQARLASLTARVESAPDAESRAAAQTELDAEERRVTPLEQEHLQAIDQLEQTRSQLDDARSSSTGGVLVIGRATVPDDPVFPQPKKDLLVGLVVGALLGLGLAFVREFADDRILTEDDVERALPDVPLVATLPELDETAVAVGTDASVGIEAFRALAASVEFSRNSKPVTVIHVTSALAGEGKSTTAANLAVAFAETGTRVAVVDSDLRRPSLPGLFGIEPGIGLAGVLAGTTTLDDALQPADGLDNLQLLPPGRLPSNPTRLLYARRTEELFDQLRAQFDVVVIDSPPILPVADSLVLTQFADLVLFVVRSGNTGRRVLRRARRNLARVEVGDVVSVLNRVQRRGPDGYDYYYGRYYDDEART